MNNNPSFASRWNVDEIDRQYNLWIDSPANVSSEWQYFFEGFHLGADQSVAVSVNEQNESSQSAKVDEDSIEKHARLYGAIYAFRDIGHTQGTFDPLNDKVTENPRLSLKDWDWNIQI